MNPQRDTLSEALRELASASPEASPDLHARLDEAFLRHYARRQLRLRAAAVVALAACVVVFIVVVRAGKPGRTAKVFDSPPPGIQAPLPEPQAIASDGPKLPAASVTRGNRKPRAQAKAAAEPRKHNVERAPAVVEAADFMALPSFDPAIPVGESHMVRMNLSGSALQLIGYPVDGQLLDRHILTDVLVGQDGMPYAVRLVQSRNDY